MAKETWSVLDSSHDQNKATRQGIRLLLGRREAFWSLTVFQTVEAPK